MLASVFIATWTGAKTFIILHSCDNTAFLCCSIKMFSVSAGCIAFGSQRLSWHTKTAETWYTNWLRGKWKSLALASWVEVYGSTRHTCPKRWQRNWNLDSLNLAVVSICKWLKFSIRLMKLPCLLSDWRRHGTDINS